MTNKLLVRIPRWSVVVFCTAVGFFISLTAIHDVPQFGPANGRSLGGPSLMTVMLTSFLFMTFCFVWGCILERVWKSKYKESDDSQAHPGTKAGT
jgi:hypothetical protein